MGKGREERAGVQRVGRGGERKGWWKGSDRETGRE